MFSRLLPAVAITAALFSAACEIQAHGTSAESANGSFDRTIQVTGPVDVSVISRSGSIHLTTGAADQVQITAHIQASGSFRLSPTEQVRQLEDAPPIRQNGNVISVGEIDEIDDWMPGSDPTISYDVTVPADARVHTESRSGNQTIAALHGPLDVSSRSGNIRLNDVQGSVRLGSRSGEVEVEGNPHGEWAIETRSGNVSLRVPSAASFNLEVETHSGSIETAEAIPTTGTMRRKSFRGKVGGGGGASVVVGTRSGSVTIE